MVFIDTYTHTYTFCIQGVIFCRGFIEKPAMGSQASSKREMNLSSQACPMVSVGQDILSLTHDVVQCCCELLTTIFHKDGHTSVLDSVALSRCRI